MAHILIAGASFALVLFQGTLVLCILIIFSIIVRSLIDHYTEEKLFTYTSPHQRVCNKCGAYQHKCGTVLNKASWWEHELPAGDNPKCKCHEYAYFPIIDDAQMN